MELDSTQKKLSNSRNTRDESRLATGKIGYKKNTFIAVLSASLDEFGIILALLLGGDISS